MMVHITIIALALVACAPPEDHGLMARDGVELHQPALPVCVECLLPDCSPVDEAVRWWAAELGAEVYWLGEPCQTWVEQSELRPGVIGQATIDYDEATGEIIACRIELQRGEWAREHMFHEFGHCLGLDDDPLSLDLGSIMSDPVYPDGRLTDHDSRILEELHGL